MNSSCKAKHSGVFLLILQEVKATEWGSCSAWAAPGDNRTAMPINESEIGTKHTIFPGGKVETPWNSVKFHEIRCFSRSQKLSTALLHSRHFPVMHIMGSLVVPQWAACRRQASWNELFVRQSHQFARPLSPQLRGFRWAKKAVFVSQVPKTHVKHRMIHQLTIFDWFKIYVNLGKFWECESKICQT